MPLSSFFSFLIFFPFPCLPAASPLSFLSNPLSPCRCPDLATGGQAYFVASCARCSRNAGNNSNRSPTRALLGRTWLMSHPLSHLCHHLWLLSSNVSVLHRLCMSQDGLHIIIVCPAPTSSTVPLRTNMENMVLGRGGTISAANFGFSRVDKRKEQDFQGFCSASVAESFRGCRLEWLHRKPLEKLIDELLGFRCRVISRLSFGMASSKATREANR
jgi:hypothetical protein